MNGKKAKMLRKETLRIAIPINCARRLRGLSCVSKEVLRREIKKEFKATPSASRHDFIEKKIFGTQK